MDLARHAMILWRFRAVAASGLALGLFLAFFASYKVSFDDGPKLAARGTSTYTSSSQILVTQRGFPEGRVVLPTTTPPVADGTTEQKPQPTTSQSPLEFADPGRFMALADLYTQLITSDEVRARTPQHPSASQIKATPLPANSGTILPIIALSTVGPTGADAHQLNVDTVKALRGLLADEAAKNSIAPDERVELQILKAPSEGTLLAGPSRTASILALLLCIVGTIAVTHLLATLRPRPREDIYDLEEFEPWLVDGAGDAQRAARAASPNGDAALTGHGSVSTPPPPRRAE